MKAETRKEFEQLMTPVLEWVKSNCHPHTTILIDRNSAELLEGVAVVSVKDK